MKIAIAIILIVFLGYLFLKYYLKRKHDRFLKFYDGLQENTVKLNNATINKLLIEYSKEPTGELGHKIFNTLSQNQTYVILTYLDNNDPNDNKTFSPLNSINFRKIKNGDIGVFTDFDIMRNYVSNYISTDIILIGDFIKLCEEQNIKSITLNFTLPNPIILTTEK